jgi:hypothetical protein
MVNGQKKRFFLAIYEKRPGKHCRFRGVTRDLMKMNGIYPQTRTLRTRQPKPSQKRWRCQ